MVRTMIISGIILILIAVAVLVIGLSEPEEGFIGQLVQAIVCAEGENIVVEERYLAYDDSVSLEFYCQLEPQLRRDVTAQATLFVLIAFLIPFLSGLVLLIWGATKGQRQLTANMQTRVTELGGTFVPTQSRPKSNTTVLAEKLQQLEVAYEQRLISQDEYETSRQKIIDNMSQ